MLTRVVFLFLICGYCQLGLAQNKPTDSLGKDPNTLRLLALDHIWVTGQNPAAISEIKYTRLGEVNLSFGEEKGDYRNYNQAEYISRLQFKTEGYTKPKNITFYGSLAYTNQRESKLVWNDVSFLAPENPFIIADSIGGDYDKEVFDLKGIMASTNKAGNLDWGVALNYKVGDKVDQTDPRPSIRSMEINVKPGIRLKKGAWRFGANVSGRRFTELVDFSVEDHYTNYRYFRLMGLGMYTGHSDDWFSRDYKGWSYGGAFQVGYQSDRYRNLFEFNYDHNYERAQEGNNKSRFLAGDFTANSFGFTNRFRIMGKRNNKEVAIYGKYTQIEGLWFDQNRELGDDGTEYWQVYNESVRYKKDIVDFGMSFSFWNRKSGITDHFIKARTGLRMDMADFYPEGYFQNNYNLTSGVEAFKNWAWVGTNLSLTLGVDYVHNLKSDLSIDSIELLDRVTHPDHYYKSSHRIISKTGLKWAFPKMLKNNAWPYLAFDADWAITLSDNPIFDSGSNRRLFMLRLGINF
jgi:hypothetical protein